MLGEITIPAELHIDFNDKRQSVMLSVLGHKMYIQTKDITNFSGLQGTIIEKVKNKYKYEPPGPIKSTGLCLLSHA